MPAYAKLLTFLDAEYIPHAAERLAAEDLPDGKAYYRAQIKEFTTLDMDPEAIHQLGLSEVAKIHAQMLEVMKEIAGFKGDFPAFLKFLRTDPQFYAKTPQELLDRAGLDCQAGGWGSCRPISAGCRAAARFGIEPVRAGHRAFLHLGPWRHEHLSIEHLRPAKPAVVQSDGADPA